MRAYRSAIVPLDEAYRENWESVASDRGEDMQVDRRIRGKPPVDVFADAVVSGELIEQLGDGARAEPMDLLNLPLPAQPPERTAVAGYWRNVASSGIRLPSTTYLIVGPGRGAIRGGAVHLAHGSRGLRSLKLLDIMLRGWLQICRNQFVEALDRYGGSRTEPDDIEFGENIGVEL